MKNDPANFIDPVGLWAFHFETGAVIGIGTGSYLQDDGKRSLAGISAGFGFGSSRDGSIGYSGGVGGFTGNIAGLTIGVAPSISITTGHVEDLAKASGSVGFVFLGFTAETLYDKNNNVIGKKYGFGGKGFGIGAFQTENFSSHETISLKECGLQ